MRQQLSAKATAPLELPRPVDLPRPVALKIVSLVIPVFNEAGVLPRFLAAIDTVAAQLGSGYRLEMVFVDDGSTDGTLDVLVAAQERNRHIVVIALSRNFGKEAALTAGLDQCNGDAIIPIDVDLQDPPDLIPLLIAEWQKGVDVVLARRATRESDTYLKRLSGRLFYRVHNLLAAQKLQCDVGDFRLMDRKVVEALKSLPERRRFMKGLFSWVGFKTATLDYQRAPRAAGNSKFPFWKLWNLAIEGITSFSTVPLRIWTYLGILVAAVAFGYMGYFLLRTLIAGNDVPGYPSLLLSILFLGGIQLIGIGVLGEYLGRVYEEVKQRPNYIIARKIVK